MVTEETELVIQLKNGSENAFEKLYYAYNAKIFYFSMKYMQSKPDAEGIVQDVFTKIWETSENLDPDKSFNAFLFTITKNLIFNKHRKKLNEIAYRDYLKNYLDEIYDKTENEILINDIRSKIDAVVQQLPAKRKHIYLLSREDGLSYKEIAEQLNISQKNCRNSIKSGA